MVLRRAWQALAPWWGWAAPSAIPARLRVHAHDAAAPLVEALSPALQAFRYPSHMRSHVMSYWAVINRPHPPSKHFLPHERVALPDGGVLELHWAAPYDPAKPLLLVIPGTRGHITSRYIEWAAYHGRALGWNVVVAPLRGCGSIGVTTPRCFDGSKFWDVAAIVEHLDALRRSASSGPLLPFFGLGYSMGGGFLSHYVAEAGEACPLTAAMCVSPPTDYNAVVASLYRPSGWLYNLFLTTLVKMAFWRNRHVIWGKGEGAGGAAAGAEKGKGEGETAGLRPRRGRSTAARQSSASISKPSPPVSPHFSGLLSLPPPDPTKIKLWRVLTAFTVPQWHNAVTVHLQGASSSRHFCDSVSFSHLLPRVAIPLLLVNAENDPICRAADIPVHITTANPNIIAVHSDEGGHTGFVIADPSASHPSGGAYAATLTWDNLLMEAFFGAIAAGKYAPQQHKKVVSKRK